MPILPTLFISLTVVVTASKTLLSSFAPKKVANPTPTTFRAVDNPLKPLSLSPVTSVIPSVKPLRIALILFLVSSGSNVYKAPANAAATTGLVNSDLSIPKKPGPSSFTATFSFLSTVAGLASIAASSLSYALFDSYDKRLRSDVCMSFTTLFNTDNDELTSLRLSFIFSTSSAASLLSSG